MSPVRNSAGGASCAGGSPAAQTVEQYGREGVGQSRHREVSVGPVPLDEGIHGTEQQVTGQVGIDVVAYAALGSGAYDQVGDPMVELPAPRERPPLGVAVAVHPQQQGDVGQLRGEHLDAASYDVPQPGGCRRVRHRAGSSMPMPS
ncbi:hypothetical protein GCM10018966_049480 [Streptomyces yanii]